MATDQDLEWHRGTWLGFTRLVRFVTVGVILVIVILAFVTL
jgi:Bacterial aa3 type cytochrome c oxidase subunit IV